MPEDKAYNPLDYDNLTINLVRELMTRGPFALPLPASFPGPGVYALFYDGDFPEYATLRSSDATKPIYVGKAVPPGARKGSARSDVAPALFQRIMEHVDSINAATNLDVAHFTCRYLTVVPLWITMAELFLIEYYQPIWNVCVEGFGLHDPGAGRHQGEIPWWDALHPGRIWAQRLRQTKTNDDAVERLRTFLASRSTQRPGTP
ncbi:MAG: Eco29kI family restriction endonuclease [Salinibacterium sp.]|nr:Eco29kI family restriction endonuclease [Salinibacterium sp.]